MIEETNTVFDGDDADAASEGSVSDNNPVYPNKGNIFADKDERIAKTNGYLMKYIDPDTLDSFDQSNLCEEHM